jgi:hypothetical protein
MKPGPKTELFGEKVKCVNFTVDEMTMRKLKVLGNGNASKGVREAARVAYEAYQRGK